MNYIILFNENFNFGQQTVFSNHKLKLIYKCNVYKSIHPPPPVQIPSACWSPGERVLRVHAALSGIEFTWARKPKRRRRRTARAQATLEHTAASDSSLKASRLQHCTAPGRKKKRKNFPKKLSCSSRLFSSDGIKIRVDTFPAKTSLEAVFSTSCVGFFFFFFTVCPC